MAMNDEILPVMRDQIQRIKDNISENRATVIYISSCLEDGHTGSKHLGE
jgi:hypothetical protein